MARMPDIEILYTSEQVRRAVRSVFRANGRRVAIVGFVGKGAEAYLPRPSGLELYCWPAPGATSAVAIRKLQKLGVDIAFANRLHAKLYWSKRGGAVIASANLSTNAYGHGNLKELGVRVPSRVVDIDKVIRSIGGTPVTSAALEALKRANGKLVTFGRGRAPARTFREWYEQGRSRDGWLLAFATGHTPSAKRLRERVKKEHHVRTIANWLNCHRGEVQEDDYVLVFTTTGTTATAPEWLHADDVVRVDSSERAHEPGFPMQIGQVWPTRRYRKPPFDIDPPLRRAARHVLQRALADDHIDYRSTGAPSTKVLRALYDAYVADAG
jgi:hypothetical protein